jgi:RNA polymerase sigma-70 factor (ECF subfamily)
MSDDLTLARDGDGAAFERLVAPLRTELHAHCYRMLGSAYDADDALQDALVRAWKGVGTFAGRGSMRSWLYTVATRASLDLIGQRGRRALPVDLGPASERAVPDNAPRTDLAWLGPYPDGVYEQREAVELAFVAALQYLPGNQRAALLLFEVLGFPVAEIAAMMDTSVASVNSALQRARAIVADRVPGPDQARTLRKLGDERLKGIVTEYATALQNGDADALVALLTADVTWSMPPMPAWYRGVDAVMDFAVKIPLTSCGAWHWRHVTANGQPAVALYLNGEGWSITVFTLRDDKLAGITSFLGPELFPLFALPLTYP